jgi:hypothetical protein
LIYSATEGCPTRDAFVERLRSRTTRFRDAAEGELSRVFKVEITTGAELAHGKLAVTARDGSSASREVKATTCDQVGAALALVVAVAIDPQALVEAMPTKTEPPPVPPPPPPPPPEVAPQVNTAPPARRATRFAGGVRVDEVSGITPLLRPVLRPFFEIAGDRPGVLAPTLRVSFAWTRNAHVAASSDGADFSWYAGRIDACPVRLGGASAFLSPCMTIDAGALRVAGQDAPASTARWRPWVSTGLDVRSSLTLLGWLFAEIEIGAAAPWIKDRWIFADGTSLHTAPAVSVWTGAGIGCRLP